MKSIFITLFLIIAFLNALFLLYPSPKTEFVLATSDNKSAIVYLCNDLTEMAQTRDQAESAHTYFQEQIDIWAGEKAAEMHEAMLEANRTNSIPDLGPIEANSASQFRDIASELRVKFDCQFIRGQSL